MQMIPLVDLRQQYLSLRTEIDAAVSSVIESAAFINGPDVAAFETEFAKFCDAQHCVGVSSGLEALRMILVALGIGVGDEVIVPANTFIATALAVSGVGASVVLVDCDRRTANIDPLAVEDAITSRTKAIMPVHLYGQPVQWNALADIAAKHGVALIEDAAQAHGARWEDRACGNLGVAAAFSFYPGKNLGAFGDGGAVTTNDAALAERLRQARSYGERRKYEHVVKGGNWRLDTIQAAVLRVKLRHLAEWNEERRHAAARYSTALAEMPGVSLPAVLPNVTPVWHLYVIEVEERDRVLASLQQQGIMAGVHYPCPIHLQPAYADLGHQRGTFPNAEAAAARILSLPLFPEITADQTDRVVDGLRRALGEPA